MAGTAFVLTSGNAENAGNESKLLSDDLDFSTLFLFCPKFIVVVGLRVGSKIG